MSGEPVTIGFAGLTHLGLVSAVAAAAKGFPVVAFDPDPATVAALAAGVLPVTEPGLPALFDQTRPRLRLTADPADLAGCAVVYLAPDVPTDEAGRSDLAPVTELLGRVVAAAPPDQTVVILSQVPPGFTRAAAAAAGRPLIYQVETLIFGAAVARALNPEQFIIGTADPPAPLSPALALFLAAFGCPVSVIRFESAELAKIAINTCLAATLGIASTLAALGETLGADWAEVTPILRRDRRIGPHAYLEPGLGIGGGNIERDLVTVEHLAAAAGTDAGVVRAIRAHSAHRRDWALRTLAAALPPDRRPATVAVWGLAYKPGTRSVRNSPGVALIRRLPGWRFQVHDPVVTAAAAGIAAAEASDPLAACRGADALAIMTPWPDYATIAPAAVAAALAGRLVLDPFRVLPAVTARAAGLDLRVLGRPADPAR